MASPLYNKALIVGATSGIGEAFAEKLIATGSKVILLGRRQDRLDAIVAKNGADKASAVQFDVTDLEAIPAMADKVAAENPDLDCVFINSGVQRGLDFTQPEKLDLSIMRLELTTNYTAAVALTAAFLPHLRKQKQSHLVFISSTLGLVPSMIRTPGYNASKAAMHAFVMDVREQLRDAGQANVRVVEVFPPAVQTELHDTTHQPDLVNGSELGMPLDQYTEAMFRELGTGEEQVAVGWGEDLLKEGGLEDQRMKMFQSQRVVFAKNLSKFMKT